MRTTILALGLAFALNVAALPNPDPQFEFLTTAAPLPLPTVPVKLPNPTKTRRRKHKEPTPTFKVAKPCECIKPIVPINMFTPREVSDILCCFEKKWRRSSCGNMDPGGKHGDPVCEGRIVHWNDHRRLGSFC
jgi:hypothetical protein